MLRKKIIELFFRLYSGCTCGVPFYGSNMIPSAMASEGACDNKKCAIHWKMFQALTIITTAILGNIIELKLVIKNIFITMFVYF